MGDGFLQWVFILLLENLTLMMSIVEFTRQNNPGQTSVADRVDMSRLELQSLQLHGQNTFEFSRNSIVSIVTLFTLILALESLSYRIFRLTRCYVLEDAP